MDSMRWILRKSLWLLLPLIGLLVGWGLLRQGVTLDHLSLAGYQVEGLYLKLDKRLTLKARKVVIPSSSNGSSRGAADFSKLPEYLTRLQKGLRYFDAIEIESILFRGKPYRLIYRENIFYLNGEEYEIAAMAYHRGEWMELQLPLVRIPGRKISLSGEMFYRYRDGEIVATGFYQLPDLNGSFRLGLEGDRVSFWVDSMETGSLRKLLGPLHLSRPAREWLLRRLSARRYRLEYLRGEGELDRKSGRFTPKLSSLRGAVVLDRPRIRFHDKLKPLLARKARVVMQEGNLYFLLRAPSYAGHPLKGSNAALLHLDDPERLKLLLRLRYRGRLDWPLVALLRTYGIDAPGQKDGKLRARVDIDIPLGKARKKEHTKIQGIARLGKGRWEWRGETLLVGGGEVAFTSRLLALRRVEPILPEFRGKLSGEVAFRKRKGTVDAQVERLKIDAGSMPLVRMKDIKVPVRFSWGEANLTLEAPKLAMRLERWKKRYRIRIERLAPWHPYLAEPYSQVDDGKLTLEGGPGGAWRVAGWVHWPQSPFYDDKGVVRRFDLKLETRPGSVALEALKGAIRFRAEPAVLRLRGINVDGKRLMALTERLKKGSSKGSKSSLRLSVLGQQSRIRYEKYLLLTDVYRLEAKGENIRFEGSLGRDRIEVIKKGDQLEVHARRIGDRMLHALINFDGLQEGRYTLHLTGTEAKGYTGEIIIEGGVVRGVKAYNDLIALFNTVPALLAFSSPGFSQKGFVIKKGRILFTLKGDLLKLDSIVLEGTSATVAGKGTVELKSGALDLSLALQTARELGKALGKIPMVSYILFGKDKSLTAGVKITGTLNKPKVKTNPVGEALLYPLQLLKRTLQAPLKLGQEDRPTEETRLPREPVEEPTAYPEQGGAPDEEMPTRF